jgi:hypothetical protein
MVACDAGRWSPSHTTTVRYRRWMARRLAPSIVITLALVPACGKDGGAGKDANTPKTNPTPVDTEPPERGFTEFRNGVCRVMPDCTPPEGTNINPCNPPPPVMVVDCPDTMLPTQPPGTEVKTDPDGTCWVQCDDAKCDAPGPLRVKCPLPGAPAPDYATALVVPAATSARYDTGVFHRDAGFVCKLVECEAGTKCAAPPGRTITNVPCPPELVPKLASGIVPVMSSKRFSCYYGHVAVQCPKRFHVWH